jgi:hypothetical protein
MTTTHTVLDRTSPRDLAPGDVILVTIITDSTGRQFPWRTDRTRKDVTTVTVYYVDGGGAGSRGRYTVHTSAGILHASTQQRLSRTVRAAYVPCWRCARPVERALFSSDCDRDDPTCHALWDERAGIAVEAIRRQHKARRLPRCQSGRWDVDETHLYLPGERDPQCPAEVGDDDYYCPRHAAVNARARAAVA